MKELSIKEKTKRYDGFPELKENENEDEKIRKSLLEYLHTLPNHYAHSGVCAPEWIAWLEKQGEQKPTEWHREDEQNLNVCFGYIPDEYLRRWLTDVIHTKYDKPTDNVEPKFRVGDWIIKNVDSPINIDYSCCKITKVENGNYTIESIYGYKGYNTFETFENDYHLWTIQDAKDGDVLATDSWLYMFKYTNNKNLIQFHCKHSICPINGKTYKWFFLSDDSYLDIYIDANIHPATKEQSDFLFQKMYEACYEWDAEKKELKKVEQKTAWSEEDEEIHRKCICAMRASACGFPEEEKFVEQVDNWLKSLKDRYAWKPSEKQILAIETAINVIGKGTLNGGQLTELLEQLKAL